MRLACWPAGTLVKLIHLSRRYRETAHKIGPRESANTNYLSACLTTKYTRPANTVGNSGRARRVAISCALGITTRTLDIR